MYSIYITEEVIEKPRNDYLHLDSPKVEEALGNAYFTYTDEIRTFTHLKKEKKSFSLSVNYETVIPNFYLRLNESILFIKGKAELNGNVVCIDNRKQKLSLLFETELDISIKTIYDLFEIYIPLYLIKKPNSVPFRLFNKKTNYLYTPKIRLRRGHWDDSLRVEMPGLHRFSPVEHTPELHLSIIHIKKTIEHIFSDVEKTIEVELNSPGTNAINLKNEACIERFNAADLETENTLTKVIFEIKNRSVDEKLSLTQVIDLLESNLDIDYINFNFYKSPVNEDFLFYTFSCFSKRRCLLQFELTLFEPITAYEIINKKKKYGTELLLDKGFEHSSAFKTAQHLSPFSPYYSEAPRVSCSFVFVKYGDDKLSANTPPVDLSHLDSFIKNKTDLTNDFKGIFIPAIPLPEDVEMRNIKTSQAIDEIIDEGIDFVSSPYLFKERLCNEMSLLSIPKDGNIKDLPDESEYGVLVLGMPQILLSDLAELGIIENGVAKETTLKQLKKLFPSLEISAASFIHPTELSKRDNKSTMDNLSGSM